MEEEHRRTRRDTFLSDAEDYVDARPGYPPLLMMEAAALAELQPAAVLLEVGCGTGEATIWFARQGYRMLALDRSSEMLQLATERLHEFPNVEQRPQDFEDVPPAMRFDALLFATSFHWLDPKTRVQRCWDALDPAGALILLWHTHPEPYTGFHEQVQPIYRRLMPGWQPPPKHRACPSPTFAACAMRSRAMACSRRSSGGRTIGAATTTARRTCAC